MEQGKPRRWSVTLTPSRSLTREGFVGLMALIVAINFIGGFLFFVVGAWPVAGFMGLDVLLIWWAFRQNYADGRKVERIVVQDDIVTLHRVSAQGSHEALAFNRRWLRIELERDQKRDMVGRLLLVYRGAMTEVGSFLGHDERAALSKALREVLS